MAKMIFVLSNLLGKETIKLLEAIKTIQSIIGKVSLLKYIHIWVVDDSNRFQLITRKKLVLKNQSFFNQFS